MLRTPRSFVKRKIHELRKPHSEDHTEFQDSEFRMTSPRLACLGALCSRAPQAQKEAVIHRHTGTQIDRQKTKTHGNINTSRLFPPRPSRELIRRALLSPRHTTEFSVMCLGGRRVAPYFLASRRVGNVLIRLDCCCVCGCVLSCWNVHEASGCGL